MTKTRRVIKISQESYDYLMGLKQYQRDTFDMVIKRLVEKEVPRPDHDNPK